MDDPLITELQEARAAHSTALARLNALLNNESVGRDTLQAAIQEEAKRRETVDTILAALRMYEEGAC